MSSKKENNNEAIMNFISSPKKESVSHTNPTEKKSENELVNENITAFKESTQDLKDKQKSKRNSSAMKTIKIPEVPKKDNTKTRRVQLYMLPDVYTKLKEKSDACGRSVNDYINIILEQVVKAS